MKYRYLIILLFTAQYLKAQDCNKAILAKKPETGKPGRGSIQHVTPADLARRKISTGIIA